MALEARGLAPTEADRARVLGCVDAERLQEWLRRALTAKSLGDVFG
jgi:hypothetical protein